MRYGINIANFGEWADARTLAGLAREAEAAGWDGVFLWDHLSFGYDGPVVDPWIALAAMALSTERVRLGTLVTPLARRRPAKLARETVSLDHLSGGRLVLGVGLGHPPDADFSAFGEDADARVRARKLDEGLDVLAGFWSGRPFSYEGEHYRIAETTFLPPPVQSPRIPVWVAGYWPHRAPFRRAARWDGVALDGWWDGRPLTPDDLRAILAFIKEHRTSTTSFDVAYGAPLPGDDPARAAATRAAYAEAGLTWWITGCDPWRESLTDLRAKIHRGPLGR